MKSHVIKQLASCASLLFLAMVFLVGTAFSQELPLGASMPATEISLVSGSGSSTILDHLGENGTVVIFWGNKCPWARKSLDRVEDLYSDFQSQGVQFVLVNSNDTSAFSEESTEENGNAKVSMPYLSDTDGQLAKSFGATRMPHVYLFDKDRTLVYVGSLDDSPGDASKVTTPYLRSAIQAVLAGDAVSTGSTKAFGCMIKPKK